MLMFWCTKRRLENKFFSFKSNLMYHLRLIKWVGFLTAYTSFGCLWRKLIIGYVFLLDSSPITWGSRKQTLDNTFIYWSKVCSRDKCHKRNNLVEEITRKQSNCHQSKTNIANGGQPKCYQVVQKFNTSSLV